MTYSPLCTSLVFLHTGIFLCLAFCDQIKILFTEYFWGDYIQRYYVSPKLRIHSESGQSSVKSKENKYSCTQTSLFRVRQWSNSKHEDRGITHLEKEEPLLEGQGAAGLTSFTFVKADFFFLHGVTLPCWTFLKSLKTPSLPSSTEGFERWRTDRKMWNGGKVKHRMNVLWTNVDGWGIHHLLPQTQGV